MNAATYTAKELQMLENRIASAYKEAEKTAKKRYKELTAKIAEMEKKKKAEVKAGTLTKEAFNQWKQDAVVFSQYGADMVAVLAADYSNADKIAQALITNSEIDVYAYNSNYAAYEIESGIGAGLSFSLYDHKAVEALVSESKSSLIPLPDPNKIPVAERWSRAKITSAMTQGILAGDSIPNMAKRLESVTTMKGNVAIRNARTYTTAAENKGKLDRYQEAEDLGIKCLKIWLSAHDSRVRDSHAALDQERQPLDKPFSNGLMFCGDFSAGHPEEVYNCRCRIVGTVAKYDTGKISDEVLGTLPQGVSYEEWKWGKEHPEYNKAVYNVKKATNDLAYIDKGQVYSGIWLTDKKLSDFESLYYGGNTASKQNYYSNQIAKYQTQLYQNPNDQYAQMMLAEMQKKAELLDDYIDKGLEYMQAQADLKQALAELKPLEAQFGKKAKIKSAFGPEAYTQDRKDAALWTTSKKKVDGMMRDRTGEVWRAATPEERDAIYEYTQSYHKYNEPLRGYEYGTSRYLGVGNTDLTAGYAHNGERLKNMTAIIDKCSYDHDQWLQRGVGYSGMDKFFQCSESLLRSGTQAELEQELLGKPVTEWGFMSAGSAKGQGFSGDILLNIYAPSGTKMMYVEPFSAFGNGDGLSWNGTATQSSFGTEFETIFQQGTQFRITKIERANPWDTIYVDMEVIGNVPPQLP